MGRQVNQDFYRGCPDEDIGCLEPVDHQVKVCGFRFEPAEIEAALAQHPCVRECVVTAVGADSDKYLVAYYVANRGEDPTGNQLRGHLERMLPPHIIPAHFVRCEDLPLTPTGKIDHDALTSSRTEPETERLTLAEAQANIERGVAEIWAEVLGVESVAPKDNFFDLGGHSLTATLVIARILKRFGVEMSHRSFHEAPTLAEQAARVDQATRRQKRAVPAGIPHRRPRLATPLSLGQEEIWCSSQLCRGLPVYNEPFTVHLKGRADARAMEQALNEMIARHAVLRTAFTSQDGRPVQLVQDEAALKLQVINLQSSSPVGQQCQALGLATAEARRPFDLASPPLLRVMLVRLHEEDRLYFTVHHLIIDAFSIYHVLVPQLWTLYEAALRGRGSKLPELALQFADYACWEQQRGEGPELDMHLAYWKKQLHAAPALELPTDRPRPGGRTFHGAFQSFALDKALTDRLRALSRKEAVTLYMTLLAAFKTLLAYYTQQDDIVVATAESGRGRVELESLLGYFLNMLVLRTDLAGDPSFRQLLGRVREVILEAQAHKELPLSRLVHELGPAPNATRPPMFQVAFVMEPPVPPLESGWTVSQLEVQTGTSKFDLTLELEERAQGVIGRFEYNTDLFDHGRVTCMIAHLRTILESAVANPKQRLSRLKVLPDTQRNHLLGELSQTRRLYPREACIHELFAAQAKRSPDKVAVVDQDIKLTYRCLNERANQLAHLLRQRGVQPDTAVAVGLERSADFVVTVLAVLKAGAAYLPLDPAWPASRLLFITQDAGATMVVTRQSQTDTFSLNDLAVVDLDVLAALIERQSRVNPISRNTSDHLAYVMYTSGSSGSPKGVEVPHRSVVRLLFAGDGPPLDDRQRFLLLAPTVFDASSFELWGPLLHGSSCIVYPNRLLDLNELERVLKEQRITCLWLTAALFNAIIDEQPHALSGVCYLFVGGEALSVSHVRRALAELPHTELVNGYGPTEGTTFTCTYRIPRHVPPQATSIPIGRPVANTRVYILGRHLRPVPVGVPGELYIGGDGLARGYRQRPELTAERFLPDPFSTDPDDRLYRSGDVCRWLSDGNIDYLGRTDEQVKVRGFRVEPAEIEAILNEYPAVSQSVVTTYKQGAKKELVAYVTQRAAVPLEVDALRHYLTGRLPLYMIPTRFEVIDAMPLGSTGKVDRRALATTASIRPKVTPNLVCPRTSTERWLAEAWIDLLGVERVSTDDNFFALGGHSLSAIRLLSRIRETMGVALPLPSVWEAPTVTALASRVDAQMVRARSSVNDRMADSSKKHYPLSFGQQRLSFLHQVQDNKAVYNVPLAQRLSGALDADRLEKALNELVRRHAVLRTTFPAADGQPHQVVAGHRSRSVRMQRVDLRAMPRAQKEATIRRLVDQEARFPFDLGHRPLLRSSLLCLDQNEHVFVLVMHHIICDEWSVRVLFHELSVLYSLPQQQWHRALPTLSKQYADFAVSQRQTVEAGTFEREQAYWNRQLKGIPHCLQLPVDHPRPASPTFRGATEPIELPRDLTSALCSLGQSEGLTPFMTVLAVFKVLLARYSHQSDIVVGTPIANRDQPEFDSVIGFFLNTLPLRTDVSAESTFRQVMQRVRSSALAAYAHCHLPFDRLVQELRPQRICAHAPLFQVMFILLDEQLPLLALPGTRAEMLEVHTGTAKFDLMLELLASDGGLRGCVEYSTDLFEAVTIRRLADHLVTLAARVVEDPDRPITSLSLQSAAEQASVRQWNDTARDYPSDLCIHQWFEQQVERTPGTAAVTHEDHELTYEQLNRQANQLAHELRRWGVGPDVPVGICLERSLETMVAVLAVLKAGGACVPLEPRYPRARLAGMIEDARIAHFLVHARTAAVLPPAGRVICLDGDRAALAQHPNSPPQTGVLAHHLAYVIYTSGSTGRPKGVAMPHRPLVNLIDWQRRHSACAEGARTLQFASLGFDVSFQEIFSTWLTGGTLVLIDEDRRRDFADLLRLVHERQVERLFLPFTALQGLAEIADAMTLTPGCLREVITAGEPLRPTPALVRLFEKLEDCVLVNQYGPTESHVVSCFRLPGHPQAWPAVPPIGRPIQNVRLYLLDDRLRPVPIGARGELYIGGVALARGYLHRDDLTRARFVADPFHDEPDARLYRSGDLARYRADGEIEFLGRVDDQVKVRGFRIEPGEVEAALSAHPGIRQAVVTARDDGRGGQLVAYVVTGGKRPPDAAELRRHLSQLLPDPMVPRRYVPLESLPLTASGKVDRGALPESGRVCPRPDQHSPAPRNELECRLAEIWREVLGVESVGIRDNFFDLGGHSLLAVRLFAEIKKKLGRTVSLSRLFSAPTVEQLAVVVGEVALGQPPDLVVVLQGQGHRPPLFCVGGIGGHVFTYRALAERLGDEHPVYGLPFPGLEDQQEPRTRVEDIASELITRVRRRQPHGPYILSGYSFGGLVAYEMAQQLVASGEQIALLTLLDAYAPEAIHTRGALRRVAVHLRNMWRQETAAGKVRYVLGRGRRWRRNAPEDGQGLVEPSVTATVRHVRDASKAAMSSYRPRPYPGRVTLFVAGTPPQWFQFVDVQPLNGWRDLVEGGIEVHRVPGSHLELLKEPGVDVLAEKLRASLENAALAQSSQGVL